VDQCLRRSINTSLTTLFAVVALLIFGGDSLRTFIVALLVGVTCGAYSSIFVAPLIVYLLGRRKNSLEKFDEKEKDEAEEKILV